MISDETLKKLGVKRRDDISPHEIDIERSKIYENDGILVTKEEDILAYNIYNPILFEIRPKFKGEICYIEKSTFDKLRDVLSEAAIESVVGESEEIEEEFDTSEIIRFIKKIIADAKRREVSDIHIYNVASRVRGKTVRNTNIDFRIDGLLTHYKQIKSSLGENITNKIMNLADLDMGRKMYPQDGKFKEIIDDEPVEVRVSTAPSVHGIVAVMRLAYSDSGKRSTLEDIGFEGNDLERYRARTREPYGTILNVGATGQGKSTTFRLTIEELVDYYEGKKKIVTVEDPVEHEIRGAVQHQVNEKMGITFANMLRSLMRQDPDIIMIGEIRDEETAEIGVRASLTGHLVLATLHANDSFDAITRLRDLGISSQLISSTLNAILSQRLARKLCPHCKRKEPVLAKAKSDYGIDFDYWYVADGCEKCNNTGVSGRTAIVELLELDEEIKTKISEGFSVIELKRYAKSLGFRNIWLNGIEKVRRGEISFYELQSIAKPDLVLNASTVSAPKMRNIYYPDKKISCDVDGKECYVFDIGENDLSVVAKKDVYLSIGREYKVRLGDKEALFIPRSIAKFRDMYIFGGPARGDLAALAELADEEERK